MTIERDVMIPMRDGVRLATDIYRPARHGRPIDAAFPVILERTPYDKTVDSRSERYAGKDRPLSRAEVASYFVRNGYVVVYQDCRGRHGSEGIFTKYLNEADDGHDTCAWITSQPWCNGRIGTKGLSYAAHTQMALGCAGAPGLAAMFVDSGGFSNGYQSGIRQGGAFEMKQVAWAVHKAVERAHKEGDEVAVETLTQIDFKSWLQRLPWKRGNSPLSTAPEYEDYLFDQWERGSFDEYWMQPSIYAEGFYHQFDDVAALLMSSWYDPYARTAVENFIGLSKHARKPVRLILGPWTHGNRSDTYAGDVDFGREAPLDGNLAPDFLTLRLRWFDRWLKDIDNGIETELPITLFVMGGGTGRKNAAGRMDHGGHWRTESEWPLPDTRWTPFYLHTAELLSPHVPTADVPSLTYEYDPRNPVPTIGGTVVAHDPSMQAGAFDQREAPDLLGCKPPYGPLSERPDVLVFQTPPLAVDVEVTGPVVVNLWIASNCPDTDFTAKLVDVYPPNEDYPDGYAMNLTEGILRVRYRDSWEKPALMHPGQIYQIRIEAFPTSNLFKRGHRIRLDISSSNFPHFDVNPNTGEPEARASSLRVATNQVFVDADHPSHVLLPIIPARDGSA